MTLPKLQTWVYESAVVLLVLSVPVILRGFLYTEVICAVAVWITFMHGQVADRMQEAQKELENTRIGFKGLVQANTVVECHRWSNRYFLMKEALWITFFLLIGSYAAVTGSVLFFLYPFWRKWYRHHQRKAIIWHKLNAGVDPNYFVGVDPVGKNGPDSEAVIFKKLDPEEFNGGPLKLRFRGDDGIPPDLTLENFYETLYNKTTLELGEWWRRKTDLHHPWERADVWFPSDPAYGLRWTDWWMEHHLIYRTLSNPWPRKYSIAHGRKLNSHGRTAPAVFGMRYKK